jgi:hypothetical protein
MRIGACAEIGDDFGQWIREVLIIADAEAVPLHDHLAAKAGWFVVEGDDGRAFFGHKDWIGNSITAGRERFLCFVPVESVDSFLYVGTHG